MKKLILTLPAFALLAACDGNMHGTAHTTPKAFALADVNNSNSLDFSEYRSLMQVKALDRATAKSADLSNGMSDAKLRKQFDAMDGNHNGALSRSELGVN